MIWFKNGSDKRTVNSKEELRRIFQITDQFHADELPTKARIDKLDKLRFRDFLKEVHKREYPDSENDLMHLLQNMNLATEKGFIGSHAPTNAPETVEESAKNEFLDSNAPELENLSGHQTSKNDLLNDLIKLSDDLLNAIQENSNADYLVLAKHTRTSEATVKRRIQKLKKHGILRRVGSRKTGHWEINLPLEIKKKDKD